MGRQTLQLSSADWPPMPPSAILQRAPRPQRAAAAAGNRWDFKIALTLRRFLRCPHAVFSTHRQDAAAAAEMCRDAGDAARSQYFPNCSRAGHWSFQILRLIVIVKDGLILKGSGNDPRADQVAIDKVVT